MFDLQATIAWITQVIKDPNAAAAAYRTSQPPWLQTFMQITMPAYVGALVVGYIIALITGGSLLYGPASFGVMLFSVIWSLVWTFVVAFILDFVAGNFDGQRNFNAAYALVGLAIVPAALGNALSPLPVLGWLIGLVAGIYSLVLAYRFVPVFLEVPEAQRVKHFVISVIAAFVVNIVIGATVSSMFLPSAAPTFTPTSGQSGIFGADITGRADFAQAAAKDTYDPPSDGRLREAQVENYADVLEKTQALRDRLNQKFDNMDEGEASVSDILRGVGDAMRLGTAEMEVVKTRGGNWAEHMWVKNQIETARVQQDVNDTVKHNYALFLEYQEEIEAFD
ncbi:MAG: hypothetical protein CMQ49_12235 [Gammaproteobacteria bacterium]|nr:hypothetical protein [Gammaproteobacteria bacterium]|tara:strand:+ start:1250 stop:2260 length:1011 start_codon:yes stop_codon:yes gene_type:complete